MKYILSLLIALSITSSDASLPNSVYRKNPSGNVSDFGQVDLSSPNACVNILPNGNTTATSANTGSAIVARDGSGNFSAGTITATLNGIATNVNGTVAVANGGLGISTTPTNGQIPIGNGTNYVAASISAGTNITVTPGAGTITISATGGGSGNLSAKFSLENSVIPFLEIGGHTQITTQSLSTINIGLSNCGISGTTQIRVNQYHNSTTATTSTATIAASIDPNGPCTSVAATLTPTLSLISGDRVTVDVVSVSGGSPENLTVEY